MRKFPEIDRAEWFKIDLAKRKILKSQLDLLRQLEHALASRVWKAIPKSKLPDFRNGDA
jgi:predicted NUDIX family NTP pyrophosphohydrolase